jgi:hypothetical protein
MENSCGGVGNKVYATDLDADRVLPGQPINTEINII